MREAIRKELETTKARFHQLLQSIPEGDLTRKSTNPAWTVAQVLYHMSVALRFLPSDIALIRRSGRMPKPPAFVFHTFNVWLARWGARKASHDSLAAQYDQAHARTVEALESIEEDEWQKGADYPGWDPMLEGHVTIEELFHYPTRHFEAHAQEIR
jgi:hypothetical protein